MTDHERNGQLPERLLEWAAGVVSVIALVSALLGVVNRLWLDGRLHGIDEIARFSLAWFTALAVGIASARSLHYRIGLGVTSLLPRRLKRGVASAQRLVADVAIGGLILWASMRWLPTANRRRSLILEVPLSWAHAAVAVMGVLLILFGLRSFLRDKREHTTTADAT